jgi:hypothetical protein
VKHFWLILAPVVALVAFWAPESRANRSLVFRVQQALILQQVDRPGYVFQGTTVQLAHPADRLDCLGAGVQTGNGTIVIALDTQAGELKLAPHSRLRITNVVVNPDGSKLLTLTVDQGRVELRPQLLPQLLPQLPPQLPPQFQGADGGWSWDGVRARLWGDAPLAAARLRVDA